MGFLVLPLFGLIAFLLVFVYQRIVLSHLSLTRKLLLLFFVTFLVMLTAYFNVENTEEGSIESAILNPIAAPIEKGVEAINTITESKELEKIVTETIESENGTYGVVIKNLKTGEYYTLNEERKFDSASLYKLWTMASTFQEIEDGELSMETGIGFDAAEINRRLDIASESAELTEGRVSNTVKGALERMITISDNYSAHILSLTVGYTKINAFLKKYNFSNSNTGSPPRTTPQDIADYFEALYNKKLISKSASEQMLEILKRQQLNDRIPEFLPEGTQVAHKTGELGAVKHDAGIVFSKNGDYIIVLMSETNSQAKAAKVEAEISGKVWEFFNK